MQKAQSPTAATSQWTIVVDLQVNLPDKTDGRHLGAEDQSYKLQQLKQFTAGRPITIVVQEVQPNPHPLDQAPAAPFIQHRYAIRDGQIQPLADVPASTIAADLEDVLALAQAEFPSEKLGLVLNSHGVGNGGVSGDIGFADMDSLVAAMQRGLQPGGRDKLDIVNLDSCLMGQVGVLDKMAFVTRDLIASPEIEDTKQDTGLDGQELNAWLAKLLKDPQMNGYDLAEAVVTAANEGWNVDALGRDATPTLAHYNLREPLAKFMKSFDEFGQTLANATNGSNEAHLWIEGAIADTPKYGKGLMGNNWEGPLADLDKLAVQFAGQKRDLGTFAENLLSAIQSGSLPDRDGQIRDSISNLLTSKSELVSSSHVSGPIRMGDLSVFLPDRPFLSVDAMVKVKVDPEMLASLSAPSVPAELRKLNLEYSEKLMPAIEKEAAETPEARRTIADMKTALHQARTADAHDPAFLDAERMLHESATQLSKMEPFASQDRQRREGVEALVERVNITETETHSPGWKHFLDAHAKPLQ